MVSHVLPRDHSASELLNTLFGRFDVIDNETTFLAAGFDIRRRKQRSLMRVATHPALPGYVFKVFFVDERAYAREKLTDWRSFAARCNQADRIRRVVEENHLRHFIVPRKWLFHTPPHPACGADNQPAILVAEFQDLVSREENERAWLHSVMEAHLDELYTVITRAGGASYRPDNIRLTREGRFAFIDTEHASGERDYESICPYLSHDLLKYWSKLVHEGSK